MFTISIKIDETCKLIFIALFINKSFWNDNKANPGIEALGIYQTLHFNDEVIDEMQNNNMKYYVV